MCSNSVPTTASSAQAPNTPALNSASSCQSNNADRGRLELVTGPTETPVGAKLAREDGPAFNIDVDSQIAFASKLRSYRGSGAVQQRCQAPLLKLP
ncbi:hypothetical protein EMIT0P253_40253 [Pseudomonas sp. IT-P253]